MSGKVVSGEAETAARLVEILEAAEFRVLTDYSGRGMMGRTCIGGTSHADLPRAAARLVAACDDVEEAALLLETLTTDNMGHGVILYWPAISAPAPQEETA